MNFIGFFFFQMEIMAIQRRCIDRGNIHKAYKLLKFKLSIKIIIIVINYFTDLINRPTVFISTTHHIQVGSFKTVLQCF